MECPFHAGNEAITTCVQCETPICPLCTAETNQVHLCLNCYRARVEEFSGSLGSASVRLAKDRKKTETKMGSSRKKKKEAAAAAATVVAARPSYRQEDAGSLWDKEAMSPVTPGEMAPPEHAPADVTVAPPIAVPAAPVSAAEQPSKKELARMQKEEAKRLKEEEKAAKKAAKAAPAEMPAEPPSMPEPAPFFEPAPEPPDFAAPPQETVPAPEAAPPPLMDIPSLDLPPESPGEGVKLPRLEERLEPLPPGEEKEPGPPPGAEPPEGFFD